MPRTTREWAMRKLEMAAKNLETARGHIAEVIEKYVDQQPGIASNMITLFDMIQMQEELIRKIRRGI